MATAVLRATTIPATTLAAAIALGALFAPPTARAGEYCRQDTDHMTGCGFSLMEQCEETRSGLCGDCFGDPFLKDNSTATINRNAYAYSPRPTHGGRGSPAMRPHSRKREHFSTSTDRIVQRIRSAANYIAIMSTERGAR